MNRQIHRLFVDPDTGQRHIITEPVGYAPEAGAPVELRRHIARESRGRDHAAMLKAAEANFNQGNRQFREQQEREACASELKAAGVSRSKIYELGFNGNLTPSGVQAYLLRNARRR
jgi:hypothetical protein